MGPDPAKGHPTAPAGAPLNAGAPMELQQDRGSGSTLG